MYGTWINWQYYTFTKPVFSLRLTPPPPVPVISMSSVICRKIKFVKRIHNASNAFYFKDVRTFTQKRLRSEGIVCFFTFLNVCVSFQLAYLKSTSNCTFFKFFMPTLKLCEEKLVCDHISSFLKTLKPK
jgi:hypothetical protein